MPDKFIVIFVTAPSRKEAAYIVSILIKKRLVACGNILRSCDSVFIWKGKQNRVKEVLIILKTRKDLFKKVAREIKGIHSYEVPEIIAVPIIDGTKDYLNWINKVVITK
ncbi:MAG: divalent-cation tolerance protein CutA [Candidatus Omnitrophica bacterium]|nr:divalent-cation tolerance protein CutA [Candidatus Omnitrophota bacterium]